MDMKIEQEKLANALNAVSIIVDEPTFKVSSEGIAIRSMDPARVAMVDFMLQKEAFSSYSALGTDVITLNLTEIKKILNRAKKDDVVGLEFTPGKKARIEIKGNYYRLFTVPVLSPFEGEETPLPKVNYTASAKLAVEGFREAILDANMVSDHVLIEIMKNRVNALASGDITTADIQLKIGDNVLLDTEVKEAAKSYYSLSYLVEIMKAVKNAAVAELHISTDLPLKLKFEVEDCMLDYYLAPRISNE